MKTFQLMLFVALLFSCAQSSKQKNSIPNKINETHGDSLNNSIIITNADYILSLNDIKDTFKTVAQLSKAIEKAKKQIGQDSVHIYMRSTVTDKMVSISPILRKLNIDKYRFIITEEYFVLPYPDDNNKINHQ